MRDLPTGTVTFLFTDIEGSTRLLRDLGEGYRAVQDDHARILRAAIAQGGGVDIRTEGDSFFAAFRSATQAVKAAVAAQRALAEHRWSHGEPLRVRMGLHTGEGILGGDDYIGIEVNRAARIAAAGHGGQVLLSGATRGIIENDLPERVRLRDLGDHRLKDFPEPERLFQLDISGLLDEFPPLKTLDARPNNLPAPLTSFVGREREIARVKELVPDHRLTTITGPGGAGKTRLALEVAHDLLPDFENGVYFVDLSALRDPELVPSAIAHALAVLDQPGRPLLDDILQRLGDREVLLLLDNFEQVVEAAAEVERLLRGATGLRVLVTSRLPLRLPGEREFQLPTMALPDPGHPVDQSDAVKLFIERARAVDDAFAVTDDNAAAVAEVTARLDGLPLAIELAASRVRVLTPRAMLERLERRLPVLDAGPRTAPERQRTLRRTIEWSYDLLDEAERRLFARLSVFAGGFSLEGAEAVSGDGLDVLAGLSSLVEKNLVHRSETPEGEPRFRLLETVREYATERLEEAADAATARRRHAEHFLAFAEDAEPHLIGEQQVRWLDRVQLEHDNVREAIRWTIDAGETDLGLRIATAAWRFWSQRGPVSEGRRLLADLLAAGGSPAIRGKALIAAGGLAYWQADWAAAIGFYEESLAIARETDDPEAEMWALYNLAWVAMARPEPGRDLQAARAVADQALTIGRRLGHRSGIASSLTLLAAVLAQVGEHDRSLELHLEAKEIQERLGNRWDLTNIMFGIAQTFRIKGEHEEARSYYRAATDMLVAAGNRPMMTALVYSMASLESAAGRHERAMRLWGAGVALDERMGSAPTGGAIDDHVEPKGRAALGDAVAERALAEGRAMELEDVIAYIREDAPSL